MKPSLHIRRLLRKALCLTLSVSLSLVGVLPTTASAQSFSCDAWAADAGLDQRCAAVRIGGSPVGYPKLQWERVSDMPISATPGATQVLGSNSAVELANKAALVLGISPSEIANLVRVFPSNVPYVFARHNPLNLTLRIDVFKIEKFVSGTQSKAGLFHAQFGPAHGDYWKVNRSYISPDSHSSGMVPGVNPFERFKMPGSDMFQNITVEGAQVAIGHAMRLTGSPLGLFAVAQSRPVPVTKKSGGLLIKKTETIVYAHVKPRWYIAQPANLLNRSTSEPQASFCAADPEVTPCFGYATAVSGVAFEEFDGGTLSDEEDIWEIDRKKKYGLGFLGALLIAVVASVALVAVMGAAGIGAVGVAAPSASGITMGTMGNFLVNGVGIMKFGTTFTALAFETAYLATSMALAGANLGSTININAGVLLGFVSVQKGYQVPDGLSTEYGQKISDKIAPLTSSSLVNGPGTALIGFDKTVLGNCSPGALCATGAIQRVDQYLETNEVQFVRDNGGNILRDAGAPITGFPQ